MFSLKVFRGEGDLTVVPKELFIQNTAGSLHCCVCDPDTSYPKAIALGAGVYVFPQRFI